VIASRYFEQHLHHEALRKKLEQNIAQKLSLIETLPENVKEVRGFRKELGELLGVREELWAFKDNVAYKIEQLKEMANENARKTKLQRS